MDPLEILDRSAAGFASALAEVGEDQWHAPTGNAGQDVQALVDHVIGGNRMATAILTGGSREDGLAQFARADADTDRVVAFQESRIEMAAAFAQEGAMDRIVAHPAMDMPGSMLLSFRIGEYALHGWDLATAVGADDTIEPDVVEALSEIFTPMAGMMAASGMFGEGPSGSVPDDAPLQTKVLDLSGRRP